MITPSQLVESGNFASIDFRLGEGFANSVALTRIQLGRIRPSLEKKEVVRRITVVVALSTV